MERLKAERLSPQDVSDEATINGSDSWFRRSPPPPPSCGGSGYDGQACNDHCTNAPSGGLLNGHAPGWRRRPRLRPSSIGEDDSYGNMVAAGIEHDLADGGSDDTVDGATDNEDLHTEDDSSHLHATTSSRASNQYLRENDDGIAAAAVAAARVEGRRVPENLFRRRGWSSSAISFTDDQGYRAAREDLAVSFRIRL